MDQASTAKWPGGAEIVLRRGNDEEEARDGLAAQRLEKLEAWYQNCLTFDYKDDTLEDEVLDSNKIDMDIMALVPGYKKDLTDGYCQACRKFQDSRPRSCDDGGGGRRLGINTNAHMSTIKELLAASQAGCRLCSLFRQHIDRNRCLKMEQRLEFLGKPSTLFLVQVRNNKLEIISLTYQNTGDLALAAFAALTEVRALKVAILSVFSSSKLDSFSTLFTLSDSKNRDPIDRAKQWLAACTQDHPLCKSADSMRLPTRLLFLPDDQTVRLAETANLAGHVAYATLSHCWGGLDFLKLTTGELESFKNSIPIHLLTRTFQDAIHVTRNLGLQYLWIDSLCIIQDSTQDWETEAGYMASVYGGSRINIAASAAKDGSEGLFLTPDNFIGVARISSQSLSPLTRVYTVAASSRLYEDAIPNSHLSSRAWTLQERLLAHRTLHFGSGGLFWECASKVACEYLPDGIPKDVQREIARPRQTFQEDWVTILHLYSKSQLTYKSDKLVALAGIARKAQMDSGDEYIAGLWRTGMEELLCWANIGPPRRKGGSYQAPTWSWASVDGAIRCAKPYTLYRLQLYSTVLDVTVSAATQDPFGQLSDGKLTLRCSTMLSANAVIDPEGHLSISLKGTGIFQDVNFDIEETTNIEAVFVPVAARLALRHPKERGELHGLVLQSTGGKTGEFERIGLLTIATGPWNTEWVKLRAALEEFGESTARENCAETR
ncbi:HET-domain-containing protein, partial [Acephala macrosclerotiorum]